MTLEKFTKYDGEKVRFDLLYGKFIEGMAQVMTFGAQKYTKDIRLSIKDVIENIEEDIRCNNAPNVSIRIEKLGAKECVDLATKKIYEKEILTSLNDKERIEELGKKTIQKLSKDIGSEEEPIQKREIKIEELKKELCLEGEVLRKRQVSYYCGNKKIDVRYAKDLLMTAKFIWIITINLEKLEDIYVVGAITDLDFLMIALKVLEEQSSTLRIPLLRNLSIDNDIITLNVSGAHNWHKCNSMRRYFSALMRHMWAWWFRKEDIDPESGLHHAYHAGCCLMMLFGMYDMHGKRVDDRPGTIKETNNENTGKIKKFFSKFFPPMCKK